MGGAVRTWAAAAALALFGWCGAAAQNAVSDAVEASADAAPAELEERGFAVRPAAVKSACDPSRERAAPQDPTRVALIVANQAYAPSIGRLSLTFADGETMCEALEALGFAVEFGKDLGYVAMEDAVERYTERLRAAGPDAVGFIYFAGHGAALDEFGDNYLIPVDAEIQIEDELEREGYKLGRLLRKATRQPLFRAQFIVIDACRNVAFASRRRSASRGFVAVEPERGVFVAFSTAPGDTALDANYFSDALAAEIQKPNQPAYIAFRRVRGVVLDKTNGDQHPWVRDSLVNTFYFKEDANAPAPTEPLSPPPTLSPAGQAMMRHCPDCPEVVVFFPPADEEGAPAPFALARTEVTFDDWEKCVAAGGCARTPDDAGWGRGLRPVINVSHAEARAYVRWLAAASGLPYRLPTEAEWTYAARAGSSARFAHGGDPAGLCSYANGAHHQWVVGLFSGSLSTAFDPNCRDDGATARTAPTASYEQSRFGLFDMAGNVWEWVDGCWRGDAPDCERIIKGGSWNSAAAALAPAGRARAGGAYASSTIGFRVALDLN